jgi:hypothetical protein
MNFAQQGRLILSKQAWSERWMSKPDQLRKDGHISSSSHGWLDHVTFIASRVGTKKSGSMLWECEGVV